jgi:hypothetical protein
MDPNQAIQFLQEKKCQLDIDLAQLQQVINGPEPEEHGLKWVDIAMNDVTMAAQTQLDAAKQELLGLQHGLIGQGLQIVQEPFQKAGETAGTDYEADRKVVETLSEQMQIAVPLWQTKSKDERISLKIELIAVKTQLDRNRKALADDIQALSTLAEQAMGVQEQQFSLVEGAPANSLAEQLTRLRGIAAFQAGLAEQFDAGVTDFFKATQTESAVPKVDASEKSRWSFFKKPKAEKAAPSPVKLFNEAVAMASEIQKFVSSEYTKWNQSMELIALKLAGIQLVTPETRRAATEILPALIDECANLRQNIERNVSKIVGLIDSINDEDYKVILNRDLQEKIKALYALVDKLHDDLTRKSVDLSVALVSKAATQVNLPRGPAAQAKKAARDAARIEVQLAAAVIPQPVEAPEVGDDWLPFPKLAPEPALAPAPAPAPAPALAQPVAAGQDLAALAPVPVPEPQAAGVAGAELDVVVGQEQPVAAGQGQPEQQVVADEVLAIQAVAQPVVVAAQEPAPAPVQPVAADQAPAAQPVQPDVVAEAAQQGAVDEAPVVAAGQDLAGQAAVAAGQGQPEQQFVGNGAPAAQLYRSPLNMRIC